MPICGNVVFFFVKVLYENVKNDIPQNACPPTPKESLPTLSYFTAALVEKGCVFPEWTWYSRAWVSFSASTSSRYGRSVTSTRPML